MLVRILVFIFAIVSFSPAGAQDALRRAPAIAQPSTTQPATPQPSAVRTTMTQDAITQVASQLNGLSRSEILRAIKEAENQMLATDLEPTIADARLLAKNEKDVIAYYRRAAFCYRALTQLLEKNDFPNIAAIYRARAALYDDASQGKIGAAQFETREKENDGAKQRAVTDELAALDKKAAPKNGAQKSSEQLGNVLGQIILATVNAEQGDVPYVGAFNQGMIALSQNKYSAAAKLLLPLAERGERRSQYWIGYMRLEGAGLSQDVSEALKWLQRSADQGEDGAQFQLGRIYAESRPGIPRDLVLAYMWFSLAASQGDEKIAKTRDEVGALLTPAQIADAKDRAGKWKPKR